ncbi:pentatricopeptide repeat protein [Aspergillus nomiae NRRL 13137]|uniref:Pentatricopeptide repeat protein n=1 Tax=Aspergillus nomiae NRRL (strain ATCC 15546 / NRRL 13137 / CBS 260.88 / M93) TaxID=1509407 RepID=A0A0L1IRP5_ASPN3|nr:pentatricopeptide repeat protein [Aspergillus nomiae NRRL 13137]KNG82261.1 pentatricopeptide repeat protein [Aspergillus nomiae NRRL 13137]
MSFCPHHLLRSRFSAGLPSRAPKHRLRLGHCYRQSAKFPTTRHVANYASTSNTTHYAYDTVGNDLNPRPDSNPASIREPRDTRTQAQAYDLHDEVSHSAHEYKNEITGGLSIPYLDGIPGPPTSSSGERHLNNQERKFVYATRALVDGKVKYTYKARQVSQETYDFHQNIKMRSLSYDREEIHTWRTTCNKLWGAALFDMDIQDFPVSLMLNDADLSLLEKIKTDCLGNFREAWEALDKSAKAPHWKRLSLWLLQNSPHLALEFFLVTCQSADKPLFAMVSDCFLFLDKCHAGEFQHWEKGGHTYVSLLLTCLDPSNWPVAHLGQKGIRLYLKNAGPEELYHAWTIVDGRRNHITSQTWLCFMRQFTEIGDIHKSLEALELVRRREQDNFLMDSQGVMRHCCKLLLLDSVQDTPNGRNFYILPKLLKMGVRPDRDMMNIVLSNAFKTGDPQVGFDMFRFMRRQSLEPDSFTYLTLLNDAVTRGDRERVQSLIQDIRARGLEKNDWIASKIFHAHFTFNAKHHDPNDDPNGVFYSLLDMYNQLYDITPLKELSIIPPEYTPPPGGDNLQPSLIALYLMIATYLRCQKRISHAHRIYTKFKALVSENHPIIAPLACTDHTYNEFLVAFRDDPRGLRPAVRLVEDMLHSSNEDREPEDGAPVHGKPSVRTWTILMSAFTFNKQPLAAEKVREMMAKHGVEYNKVTWNMVINTYANAQNISEVAKSIKAMEAQGYSMDSYTMKCLRYLQDPERLWIAVEELDKEADARHDMVTSLDQTPLEHELDEEEHLLEQGLRRLRERKQSTR